jgi:hypothetical protein
MDVKKIVGLVIGIAIAIASAVLAYDFKADVCGTAAPAAVSEAK